MLNVINHSKYNYYKRRHTDAGEHALSIITAKNELESQSTHFEFSPSRRVPDQDLQFNSSNSNPGLFKRLFRSKSFKKPDHLHSFPFEQSNLIGSNIRSIFLLFRNRLEEVTLPVQPTFDWLVLTFKLIFDMNIEIGGDTKLSFVIKQPNSDFFDVSIYLFCFLEFIPFFIFHIWYIFFYLLINILKFHQCCLVTLLIMSSLYYELPIVVKV